MLPKHLLMKIKGKHNHCLDVLIPIHTLIGCLQLCSPNSITKDNDSYKRLNQLIDSDCFFYVNKLHFYRNKEPLCDANFMFLCLWYDSTYHELAPNLSQPFFEREDCKNEMNTNKIINTKPHPQSNALRSVSRLSIYTDRAL